MDLAPGTRLGPYQVSAALGAGGMGEVYRARDPRLERDVAVKVLPAAVAADPERMRRFEQEARAAGALNHPNVVATYDIGTQDGQAYVVFELLEGETLRRRLDQGPLSVRKALDYAAQAARGLAAAHERAIVHRDLKPENLFLTQDGHLKILDFGLAKLKPAPPPADSEAPTMTRGTDPGMVLGSMGYMSPEQVRGQEVDHRADLFALGAILYEMISGRRAFRGDSAADTLTAILKEDPPDLTVQRSETPPGVERVVRHCLEKRAADRFQSARDLAFDLESLSSPSSATVAGASRERNRDLRVRGLAALSIAAAAAVLFLAGRAAAPHRPEPRYQRVTFRNGAVVSARFAPDAETVVYGARWAGAPLDIYSSRLDSPESRPLGVAGATVLAVSSQGEMALALDYGGVRYGSTLARMPVAGGAPRRMAESVIAADWSPDGSQMAVIRWRDSRNTLEYPVGTVIHTAGGYMTDVRVSPDGRHVAYIDHPLIGDTAGAVAVVDAAGGSARTLSAGWSDISGLAFTPRGNELLFTASRGPEARGVHAVSLRGRQRLVERDAGALTLQDVARDGRVLLASTLQRGAIGALLPGETRERDLSWLDNSVAYALSADGQTILFGESGQGGGQRYGVYIRSTSGGPAIRIGEGSPLAMSADKSLVLAMQLSPPRLVLLPTGTGEPRLLPGQLDYQPLSGAFLPDGKRVVFIAREVNHPMRTWVQDMAGGAPRPLTPEGTVAWVLTEDGRYATTLGGGKPSLVSVDGGPGRPLPDLERGDFPLRWSADGRFLYLLRSGVPASIVRLDATTGARQHVRDVLPADPAGVGFINTVLMTPDLGTIVYSYRRTLSDLYVAEGLR
jgi:hypothetical protein